MDAVDIVHGVNVFFGALLVGAVWMETFMLIPLWRESPPAEVLRMHRKLSPMGLAQHGGAGAIAYSTAVVLFFLDLDDARAAAWCMLAGLGSASIAITAFLLRYMPLGNRMLRWETPAPEFDEVFARWAGAQYIRTFFFTCALILFIIGAIVR